MPMNPYLPNDKQNVDEAATITEKPLDEPCPVCGGCMFKTVYSYKDGFSEVVIDCEDCNYQKSNMKEL
jgi:C4-type Zn-finger protein